MIILGAHRVIQALRDIPRGHRKQVAHRAGISPGTLGMALHRDRLTESAAAAVGYRKVILWMREEELALADRIEEELLRGSPFEERE